MTWPGSGETRGQTAQPLPVLRVAQREQRQGGLGNPDSVLFHPRSQGLRKGRQTEGTWRDTADWRPGLEPLPHCTGRSSNVTLETTGACGQEVEEGQTEELTA